VQLSIRSTLRLSEGVEMPRFGLGTYKSAPGAEVERSVEYALEAGYRLIDTAALYDNEEGVGAALRTSGLPRDEYFVTTKVWNDDQGYEPTMTACRRSLEKLGTGYVDLYVIHWPIRSKLEGTWRAMEELMAEGATRAIGVCNFVQPQIMELLRVGSVPPAINQIEFNPQLQQPGLQAYLADRSIALQAWAPIMRGRVADIPQIVEIGRQHGRSPAQVTIRWVLQKGHSVIPKSVHRERVIENAAVFDFELTDEQMATIDALDRGTRLGKDPLTFVW
jgi:diketogulonate reductase-like aldo/keto reductase